MTGWLPFLSNVFVPYSNLGCWRIRRLETLGLSSSTRNSVRIPFSCHWRCSTCVSTSFTSTSFLQYLLISADRSTANRYYRSSHCLQNARYFIILIWWLLWKLCYCVSVLTFILISTQWTGGEGPIHYGVCSSYLSQVNEGDKIQCFFRR